MYYNIEGYYFPQTIILQLSYKTIFADEYLKDFTHLKIKFSL